jgi:hypothetical protein
MSKATITDTESTKIESLLSQKLFTLQDVVNALDCKYTEGQIKYHVTKKYPHLKGNFKKEYSKGGTKIDYLLKQIFPARLVEPEVHIGERLRVDFVVGSPYHIAFEFDGTQHDNYSLHLHGSRSGFAASKQRDSRKEFLLQKRGVTLVRISDLDISLEKLKQLIDFAGYGTGEIDESFLTREERLRKANDTRVQDTKIRIAKAKELVQTLEQSPSTIKRLALEDSRKVAYKEKQREFRKQQYQKAKEWRKQNLKK